MANYYVKSGAAGAADGSSWADAYTTLAAALAARSAGDTFWVSHQHAETQASAMTLTSPGTAAAPCRILCVNDGASPPTALATTGTITTTGATNGIAANGFAYVYGLIFQVGTGAGSPLFTVGATASDATWTFEASKISLVATNSTRFVVGTSANSGGRHEVVLLNTTMKFAGVGQGIRADRFGRITWKNTASAIDATGSIPTTLLLATGSISAGVINFTGLDLSAMGSGKNLADAAGRIEVLQITDCKLGASVGVTTGSFSGPSGGEVRLVNCDSGSLNCRYSKSNYHGTITQEAVIVRAGGATDGATPISRKMVSSAGARFESPLVSDPIEVWNETIGSAVTITVPVITDNVTLTDAEAWIEVEYLGTSGFPIASFASDRATDVMATPANQASDAVSSWTTTGLTTPVKQTLAISVTPQMKGVIRARVMLAKASATMYFDPLIVAGSRQWQSTAGFINDPVGGGSGGAFTFA